MATSGIMSVGDNSTVTIGHAQSWYAQADGVVRASALREVIGWMIQNNAKTEFENDSYLDALVLTEVMFSRSTHSIQMFTGPSCEDFLKTLQNSFISAAERLKSAKGKIRILMIADSVPAALEELKQKYSGTVEVALAKAREGAGPISHFFVCDSKMARVEQPHPPLNPNTPINAIKARVFFNDSGLSQMLEGQFSAMWKIVTTPLPAIQPTQTKAVPANT
jgi:hypothetical protein